MHIWELLRPSTSNPRGIEGTSSMPRARLLAGCTLVILIAVVFPLAICAQAQERLSSLVMSQEGAGAVKDSVSGVASHLDTAAAFVAKEDTTEFVDKSYSEYGPGKGFKVASTPQGDLWISAYVVWRYINQLPAHQSFTDHLGRQLSVDTRQDLQWHRMMIHFRGWMFSPKLNYTLTVWNVFSVNNMYIIGNLTYCFDPKLNVTVGIDGAPGTRSLLGSHPLWLSNDRVLADDFIRNGFSSGISISGEVLPRFFYKATLVNNLSQINLVASQLTRDVCFGASVWWQPTTGEFGPRGAYGDFEGHESLATRFGIGTAHMPHEDRYADISNPYPGSTQVRLADSRLLFERGALADTVTVLNAGFHLLSFDAGFKYRGFFLQTEFSTRWLNSFQTTGPVPVSQIVDRTWYIQAAFFPIPKSLEVYAATSQIFGDKDAGFSRSYEYLFGTNFYPFGTRYFRINGQYIYVYHCPASSAFGFYQGGETGPILSVAVSLFF